MSPNSQEQSGSFSSLKHDEAAITSPGALLRDRRLALHLNEWDIAREMRLQTQYILDLETDNFQAFSSLAFVRGYLRGYAKIVGIPEAEIMQLFNQLALQEKASVSIPKYITHDKSHSDRYWRWMGFAVMGFVLVSLILWWQNYNSSLKTMNTSVNSTLEKVSSLQNTLNAETQKAQTEAAATVPTPTTEQVSGTLGTSATLLGGVTTNTTTNSNAHGTTGTQAVSTTPVSNSGMTTATPATPNATTPLTTVVPVPTTSNAPMVAPVTPDALAAPSTTMPNTVAPTPPKKSHQSNFSSAHDPVVEGQAPRLDSPN